MFILFFSNGKFVLQVQMCMYNFNNIFDLFTDDQKADWFLGSEFGYEFKWLTNKELVQKVWFSCVEQGYIQDCYETMGCFVDSMKIEEFVEQQI